MNKITCPCCGYRTMDSDGNYDICRICFWEDDPVQKEDIYAIGANAIPLIEAQSNYSKYGACEKQFVKNVRKPTDEDKKGPNWKRLNDPIYELKLACRKFIEAKYSVKDLTYSISEIEVASDISQLVKQAWSELEIIRFCSNNDKQREEALLVMNSLLKKLKIDLDEE